MGVSALLYIYGFSPCIQLETNSPDIIVTTPLGRTALVECTLRVADFNAKVGKLVDRRGALLKSLKERGGESVVSAVLVCGLPKGQIAADEAYLKAHRIILLSRDDLESSFVNISKYSDPDEILIEAEMALTEDNAEGMDWWKLDG